MSNEQTAIPINVQTNLESHLDDLDNIKAVVTAILALSSSKNLDINGKIKELSEQAGYLVYMLHNDLDLVREDLVAQGLNNQQPCGEPVGHLIKRATSPMVC